MTISIFSGRDPSSSSGSPSDGATPIIIAAVIAIIGLAIGGVVGVSGILISIKRKGYSYSSIRMSINNYCIMYTDQYQMARQVCILKIIQHMALAMSISYQPALSHRQLLHRNPYTKKCSNMCTFIKTVHDPFASLCSILCYLVFLFTKVSC